MDSISSGFVVIKFVELKLFDVFLFLWCVCVQFFQRLETLAREYLLEVKVRLLEQLSLGFNSPQLAISFIEMLLDEYFTLADALPYLHQLLQPLVSVCL